MRAVGVSGLNLEERQLDTIKKYRRRRSARLGIETFQHYDSVDEYRRRRSERLRARFDKENSFDDAGKKVLEGIIDEMKK